VGVVPVVVPFSFELGWTTSGCCGSFAAIRILTGDGGRRIVSPTIASWIALGSSSVLSDKAKRVALGFGLRGVFH